MSDQMRMTASGHQVHLKTLPVSTFYWSI